MPHFFALSYMHRVDYKRGGFQMIPVQDDNGTQTASIIVRYAWYLTSIPLIATATGVTSSMFALEGVALNAYALTVAHRFQRDRTNANARKIFLTSLWYLPCLLMLFLLHSKVWDEEKQDVLARFLSEQIHLIRQLGRDWCLHEAAVTKVASGQAICPVTVGAKISQEASAAVAAVCEESALTVRQRQSKAKT
jgi:protoheme IX farnesyltransferase